MELFNFLLVPVVLLTFILLLFAIILLVFGTVWLCLKVIDKIIVAFINVKDSLRWANSDGFDPDEEK